MNERIRDLQIQAFAECKTFEDGQFRTDEVFERFADLIVRECMALCKTSVGNADYNTGRLHCLENIKEHFGVKE